MGWEQIIGLDIHMELKIGGLNLSKQQICALTALVYSFGHLPVRNGCTFEEVYNKGLDMGYEKNSVEHNRYIWDNWWCDLGGGEPGHITARDAQFETYVKGIYDFKNDSEAGEVFGRNKYIYYTQEQLNKFNYALKKPITRTKDNEDEIFKYEERYSSKLKESSDEDNVVE